MKFHISLASGLIQMGALLQSSAIMVMTPDELVEFSRRHYANPASVKSWGSPDLIACGLYPNEQQLLEHIPIKTGKLLLLGMGAGREAIPFAKMGFEVTGVDFIPDMVERAIKNAERSNVQIEALVQEISTLNLTSETYDVIWLSAAMYSCFPTRPRRIQMLQRARDVLKAGGFFACEFQWNSCQSFSRRKEILNKIIAWITLGNRSYERGDLLWGNSEFIHSFSSESELVSEFTTAGFHTAWLNIPTDLQMRGEALLQKLEE